MFYNRLYIELAKGCGILTYLGIVPIGIFMMVCDPVTGEGRVLVILLPRLRRVVRGDLANSRRGRLIVRSIRDYPWMDINSPQFFQDYTDLYVEQIRPALIEKDLHIGRSPEESVFMEYDPPAEVAGNPVYWGGGPTLGQCREDCILFQRIYGQLHGGAGIIGEYEFANNPEVHERVLQTTNAFTEKDGCMILICPLEWLLECKYPNTILTSNGIVALLRNISSDYRYKADCIRKKTMALVAGAYANMSLRSRIKSADRGVMSWVGEVPEEGDTREFFHTHGLLHTNPEAAEGVRTLFRGSHHGESESQ